MEESIDKIISKESIEIIINLGKQIDELSDSMSFLIERANELDKAMQKTQNYKSAVDVQKELNSTFESVNQKYETRLELERSIKKQGNEMVSALRSEKDAIERLNKVLDDYSNNSYESANNVNRLKKEQNDLKLNQKELEKSFQLGRIGLEEYNGRMLDSTVAIQRNKVALSEANMELKQSVKEEEAIEDSMSKKSLTLGRIRDLYRSLTDEERENAAVGGVLKEAINRLDEEMKGLDKSIGNNQRNVGNYEIAGRSLRTVLLDIKNDIATQTVEYKNLSSEIIKQQSLVQELTKTKGIESDEYKKANAELSKMQSNYNTAGKALEDLKKQGGELQQSMNDANLSVKNLGKTAQGLRAVTESVGLLANTYTVFKSTMSALGIENEALMDTFAKIQILQSGINALTQITNTLTNQSIIVLKAKAIWQKVSLAYTQSLTKSTAANTASQAANTTGMIAGTAAGWSLTAALMAVGAAIKAIPGIGWILALVAAVGTLITLTSSQLFKTKELTEEQKKQKQIAKELSDIQLEVTKKMQGSVDKLGLYTKELKNVEKGSNEWKGIIREIADITGENYEELEKFPEKIQEITDAWIEQKKRTSEIEAISNKITENKLKDEEAFIDIRNATSEKEAKDAADRMNISEKERERLVSNWKITNRLRDNKEVVADFDELITEFEIQSNKNTEEKNKLLEDGLGTLIKQAAQYDEDARKTAEARKKEAERIKQQEKDREQWKKNEEKRLKYLSDIRIKLAEQEAKTDEQIFNLRVSKLEEQKNKEVSLYGKTEQEKQDIIKRYDNEIEVLRQTHETKMQKIVDDSAIALINTTIELNKKRKADGTITDEEITESLISQTTERQRLVIEQMEKNNAEQLSKLTEFSPEYIALEEKLNADIAMQKQKDDEELANIRKQGFDKTLSELKQSYKDQENAAIIAKGGALTDVEISKMKIEQLNEEKNAKIQAYNDEIIAKQEYESEMLRIDAELAASNKTLADQEQIAKQKRIAAYMEIANAALSLGSSMAGLIEDEKDRVVVEQGLAMAQVLLNQGIAISAAVLNASKLRFPANLAAIVASVSAIGIQIATSISAINQAKNAYAEGTDYHRGGSAIIGEGGEAEIVQTPKGKQFIVDKPSFFESLPIGTSVTPISDYQEAMKTHNSNMYANTVNYSDDITEMNNNIKKLVNKPVVVNNMGDTGIVTYINTKLSKTRIINKKFTK